MSVTIDLLRHGRTTRPDLLLGRTDAALDPSAADDLVRQAARRNWRSIVCSSLGRARASADILAQALDASVTVDAAWAEMDFGSWDGQSLAALDTDPVYRGFLLDPAASPPPCGETWAAFVRRLEEALTLRLERPAPQSVVVTHGGAIRAALSLTTGLSVDALWRLSIAPATRVTLRYGRGAGAWWGEIIEIVQP